MTPHLTIEIISGLAMGIAIAGVILNNHRKRACFYVWLVSNGLSAGIHLYEGLYIMTVRDGMFLILAVWGLIAWRKKEPEIRESELGIRNSEER